MNQPIENKEGLGGGGRMTSAVAEGARLTGHSGNDEIETPQALYDWLDWRFRFTLDAAASHENHKTDMYATVDGTFVCSGPDHQHAEELPHDGLTLSWRDESVFCNPPYSTELMRAFIEKAIAERNTARTIALLVKYDPSTQAGKLLRDNFDLEYPQRIQYDYPPGLLAELRAIAEAKANAKGKTLPENWRPPAATFSSVIAIARHDMWSPRS